AGSAARTFIAHDHDVAGLDHPSLDGRRGVVLALEHARAAAKGEERRVDPGRLDDATLARQVAAEDGKPPVLAVRVWHVADATLSAIEVERVVVGVLTEGAEAHDPGGRGPIELAHLVARRA